LAHYDISSKSKAPAGLGLDIKNNILFSMCATPPTCVIVNATDGTILDALPIGAGTDSGGFNQKTLEAFSSNGGGQGELTIIKENSPTSFVVEQNLKTMPGAKTCTLDSKTGRILLIATEMLAPATAPATQPGAGGAAGSAAGGGRGGAGGGAAGGVAAGGRGGGRGGRGGGRGTPAPDGFTILVVGK
jgi:hypothetical protein